MHQSITSGPISVFQTVLSSKQQKGHGSEGVLRKTAMADETSVVPDVEPPKDESKQEEQIEQIEDPYREAISYLQKQNIMGIFQVTYPVWCPCSFTVAPQ